MKRVDLYYLGPSHYCEKARKILEYKGIPFRLVNVPYGDHTGVLRISGQDYVPYVHLGGKKGVLWPEIADWAERTQSTPTLYPGTDPRASRANSRVIESWAHNVLEELVWRVVVPDVPAVLKDEVERWVFVEMQERKRGNLDLMAARKKEFLVGLHEGCSLAEDLLDGHPYLTGDRPGLADFAVYGALHPLKFIGSRLPRGHAALQRWHDRVDRL